MTTKGFASRKSSLISVLTFLFLAAGNLNPSWPFLSGTEVAMGQAVLEHTFNPGWRIVSAPLMPQDPAPSAVYGKVAVPLRLYAYAEGRMMAIGDAGFPAIEVGSANWLLVEDQTSVAVSGQLVDTGAPFTKSILAGWNLVSTPWPEALDWTDDTVSVTVGAETVPLGAAVSRGWIWGQLYDYDSTTATYATIPPNDSPPGQILPWNGYLLFSTVEGYLRYSPPAAGETYPLALISSPENGAQLTGPVDVVGTASDDDLVQYRLEYGMVGSDEYTTFAVGDTSVVDATLGVLDPTLLLNGNYHVRLTVTDLSGRISQTWVPVRVRGDLKVGNFELTYVDLQVPLSGLPIQIIRTYDSRDKRKGDFGVGWRLEFSKFSIDVDRTLGEDWYGSKTPGPFPTYCLEETAEHTVTVTLPGDEVLEFRPSVSPQCQDLIPIEFAYYGFAPLAGTEGTLSALGDIEVEVWGSIPGTVRLMQYDDDEGYIPYQPSRFRLTMPSGLELIINLESGLESATDTSGNQLTITPEGVVHSSGKDIGFDRDADGRITRLTDPNGKSFVYDYDSRGDLAAVTDPEGLTTRYTYNSSHGLLTIADPLGRRPVRNDYDEQNRLTAVTDANGNRIEIHHDLGTQTEVVTDRMGNVTVYGYDDNGNVTSEVDALGNTTTFTYDSDGNMLSKTDALGNTTTWTYDSRGNKLTETDALGNTRTWTYNSRSQVLTETDPLGNVATREYDARGNLIRKTDPLGNVVTAEYDLKGNQTATTDCEGYTTQYEYDAAGNLTREIDPLGNVTAYTYDPNGNEISRSTIRTTQSGPIVMTSTKEYDSLNRLVRTIDFDGGVTATEYGPNGKKAAQIDKNGNPTAYEYDPVDNLIKTTYPDGTRETSTYDVNGNKLTFTNRAGRTTQYEYDSLNRLTRTTYPDGSTTSTQYDAVGNAIVTTDENGSQTFYTYDPLGRILQVTDALGNVTAYAYDANGNQTTATDANGHTTIYEYDALGNKTRTIFPDGGTTTVQYAIDCKQSRKTAETDQAGNTTQYEYDALGRLVRVIDALGGQTTYTYDEVGNLLTQTDANGNTTSWAYDNAGRPVMRTLPLDMSETFVYDPNGNRIAETDFNGQTTTYTYDENDREIVRRYPDGQEIFIAYAPTGRIASVTDPHGVASNLYDSRDRLIERTDSNGATVTYTYDAKGNRTSVSASWGITVYAYDAVDRLVSVTAPDGGVTAYSYDSVGNKIRADYPNGTRTEYTYDALNRLLSVVHRKWNEDVLSSFTYTMSPTGHRTSAEEDSSRMVTYTYDAVYRLLQEAINDPVSGTSTVSYTYDSVGNRLTRSDPAGVIAYTYDQNDRLVTAAGPGGTVTYDYDANGNLTGAADGGETTQYTYDYENRLVAVIKGEDQVEYRYDFDGDRVGNAFNGNIIRYVVDKTRKYSQVLEERTPGGLLLAGYVYGDDLISQTRSGSPSFYHYDGQASTRQLTNSEQVATDNYTYDAFGILLDQTGTTRNDYLYSGEQYDPHVGGYYLRARYYDQETGRFLTQDPLLGNIHQPFTLHRYVYAKNDPENYLDPSGENLVAYTVAAAVYSALVSSAYVYAVNTFYTRQNRDIPNDICWGKDTAAAWIREFDKEHERFFTSSLIQGTAEDLANFFLPLQTRALCCSVETQTVVYCQGLGVLPLRGSCIVTCYSTQYYHGYISTKRYFPWRHDPSDPASTTAECW